MGWKSIDNGQGVAWGWFSEESEVNSPVEYREKEGDEQDDVRTGG